jgi:hypothetical protein
MELTTIEPYQPLDRLLGQPGRLETLCYPELEVHQVAFGGSGKRDGVGPDLVACEANTPPPAGIDEPQLTTIPCEADKKGNFEPAKSDGSKKAIGKSRLC